jgi:superoxide dismutase, Cu-Zn family
MSTWLSVILLVASTVQAGPALAGAPAGPTPAAVAGSVDSAAALRAPDPPVVVSDTFEAADSGASALTYDEHLVQIGARATVVSMSSQRGTATLLAVNGLAPDRRYGAHVHANRCGRAPDDAGPHVQWHSDPVQPSTNPKYANPRNEIWLDFTTDGTGASVAASDVDWPVSQRMARSVVIHDHASSTAPGHSGDAGERLACIDVNFARAGDQLSGVPTR